MNVGAGRGVAVREFRMGGDRGSADYLLFVNRKPAGVIEAKKAGTTLTGVEWQSAKYRDGFAAGDLSAAHATTVCLRVNRRGDSLHNGYDSHPASRPVFAFYRPETLAEIAVDGSTLRSRLRDLPLVERTALWPAQAEAIRNLEASLRHGRPRALIQMATGSGKTFTAPNICYRLIKHANARRILFLVDRADLGDQTLKEFQQFVTPDDGCKFTELYNAQPLKSNTIDRAVSLSAIPLNASSRSGNDAARRQTRTGSQAVSSLE